MEQGLNPFGQLRERVKQTQPEVLAEGTRFELSLSPAEKIRAEENLAFGERVNDIFGFFVQNPEDVTRDEIEFFAEEAMHDMPTKQRAVFERVVGRVLQSMEGVTEEYKEKGIDTAKRFFVISTLLEHSKRTYLEGSNGDLSNDKSLEEVEEKMADDLDNVLAYLDTIIQGGPQKMPEIKVNDLGSFVVRVKDKKDWQLLTSATKAEVLGMKILVSDTDVQARLFRMGFSKKKMEYIDRMVFVLDVPEGEKMIDGYINHELIHDLYHLAIKPETKTVYTHSAEKELFLQVKDELIAYIAGNESWNQNIFTLATHIVERTLKKNPEFANLDFAAVLEKVTSKEREELGEGVDGESRSKSFHNEMQATLREVTRLAMLRSQDYSAAISVLLSAQSFKEIAYNFSQIDAEKNITITDIGVEPGGDRVDMSCLLSNLKVVINYDLPVEGVEGVESQVEKIINDYNEKYLDASKIPQEEQFGYVALSEVYKAFQQVRRVPQVLKEAA